MFLFILFTHFLVIVKINLSHLMIKIYYKNIKNAEMNLTKKTKPQRLITSKGYKKSFINNIFIRIKLQG